MRGPAALRDTRVSSNPFWRNANVSQYGGASDALLLYTFRVALARCRRPVVRRRGGYRGPGGPVHMDELSATALDIASLATSRGKMLWRVGLSKYLRDRASPESSRVRVIPGRRGPASGTRWPPSAAAASSYGIGGTRRRRAPGTRRFRGAAAATSRGRGVLSIR